MNKKVYNKPEMKIVLLQHKCQILSGSPVTGINGNANLRYGQGNSGTARSRSSEDWDDEEENGDFE